MAGALALVALTVIALIQNVTAFLGSMAVTAARVRSSLNFFIYLI